MKYRDIEYTVVQGLGRQLWKWGFALETKVVTGQAATKAEAVAEAEQAIDRALAPKKLRGKYPPAKPGALGIGPLKAAVGTLTRPRFC
jgi:hypothetical protein